MYYFLLITGLDDEPGREGGTWLAMNKNGRLACLVNIAGKLDPNKKGRGRKSLSHFHKIEKVLYFYCSLSVFVCVSVSEQNSS